MLVRCAEGGGGECVETPCIYIPFVNKKSFFNPAEIVKNHAVIKKLHPANT